MVPAVSVLEALVLVAVLAQAPPSADACAELRVDAEPLPHGRLMPVSGEYEARVEYAAPLLNGSAACAVPACYDPASRVRFAVEDPPEYATVVFEPANASSRFDSARQEQVADTRLRITTNESAPAFRDDEYRVTAWGCGLPPAEATIVIKNDYDVRTEVTAASAEAAAQGTPRPQVTFHGTASVPPAPFWSLLLAVAGLTPVLRRRA